MSNTTYDKIIADTSTKFNIPQPILHNLIQQESGFNPNAVSPAGAQGIAQFMPSTAKGMGINPMDPTQAIPAAGQYLGNAYKQFGNWPEALASYNAGAGAVQKYGGIPPYPETQNYVKSILGNITASPSPKLVSKVTSTTPTPVPTPSGGTVSQVGAGAPAFANSGSIPQLVTIAGIPFMNVPDK